jgi:hypothetical protein
MSLNTPKWHIQAIDQGIDYIILVYGKAEGFAFSPSNLEKPFRVGGDYDGNWSVTAEGALDYCQKYLHKAYKEHVLWFVPYIEKIILEQGFSLSELDKEIQKRNLRIIKGRWPW